MKSGLEGRNNATEGAAPKPEAEGLNEVRPGRPEQLDSAPSGLSDTLVSQ